MQEIAKVLEMKQALESLKKQYEDRKKEPRHSGIIALENKIKRYENYIKIMEATKCKEISIK